MDHDSSAPPDEPAHPTVDPPRRTRLTRRGFLGGTIAAAAAVPLAACTGDNGILEATPTTAVPTPGEATSTATPGGGGTGGGGGGTNAPTTALGETWNEPWVWRPSDWPGQPLALNIVENQNPGSVVGLGNPSQVLFSYGGQTPGPTIRMRGDETLSITLRNLLGFDGGATFVGPYPDPTPLTGYVDGEPWTSDRMQALATQRGMLRTDFCLGEHTNGVHTVHTTNLHSHGLHVRPGRNPDGTHSDNVILRLIPQADLAAREADPADGEISCGFLRAGDQISFLAEDDQVGQAHYEFSLGDVLGVPGSDHPPGTHWYHPHAHGATHDQVASGMAGFLIIEGDVDDAIREAMVPDRATDHGDPARPAGPADYRERLMLVQRVFNIPTDPDSPNPNLRQGTSATPAPTPSGTSTPTPGASPSVAATPSSPGPAPSDPAKSRRSSVDAVNGSADAATIVMRPNAVERWRVLNGSVDGKGFRRLMVLQGRYGTDAQGRLVHLDEDGNVGQRVTRGEVERAKQPLFQLAMDGVTLVTEDGSYAITDLSQQGNPDIAKFPLKDFPTAPPEQLVEDYVACFADGDTLRNCYVRPNEVYMGPANRTDVFFRAPEATNGVASREYAVIALGVILHADTPLQGLQHLVSRPNVRARDGSVSAPAVSAPNGPGDVVMARLVVSGDPVEGADLDSIEFPEVPPYLLPITDDEPGLAAPGGGFRTRKVTYSGWGAQGMPLVQATLAIDSEGNPASPSDDPLDQGPNAAAFAAYIREQPDLEGLRYVKRFADPSDDATATYVLMPPNTRTMAIDGHKFNPMAPDRPRMHLDSAEEWVVCNDSDLNWGDTSAQALSPAQFQGQYDGVPLTLGDGMARWRDDPAFQILTRAVDHPFHIHQNPFWVIRIDVPAADGSLHNILDSPRWMDVVPLPRHRGRVVFRSRFPDFVGTYVNHCHILLHEDNGMMQAVEVTPFDRDTASSAPGDVEVARANYVVRDALADGGRSEAATDAVTDLYGRSTLGEAWVANQTFVDPNPTTGQSFPGFDLVAPES